MIALVSTPVRDQRLSITLNQEWLIQVLESCRVCWLLLLGTSLIN
uniref:Uncharacterized protein n=1 Tax=Anguilla anguilla TaxID=7936 RepID=A0A0E9UFH5_ANGAN